MEEQNIPLLVDIQEEPRVQHDHKVYIYIKKKTKVQHAYVCKVSNKGEESMQDN